MTQVAAPATEQTPIPPHSVAWHSLPAEQVTNLFEVNERSGWTPPKFKPGLTALVSIACQKQYGDPRGCDSCCNFTAF